MAESRVDVITEFILKKDKYLADLQGFGPQAQAAANAMDIKIPVSIADNFTAPLAAMKAAAVAPVVIPVVADTSVAQAQIAAVMAGGGGVSAASLVGSLGVGGGWAPGASAIIGGNPSWAVVGGRAGGGPAATTAEQDIAGMRQELGMTYAGRTDLAGDFSSVAGIAAAEASVKAVAARAAAAESSSLAFMGKPLPRMIGLGLAMHEVYRGAEMIGNYMDASDTASRMQGDDTPLENAKHVLELDRDAKEFRTNVNWASFGVAPVSVAVAGWMGIRTDHLIGSQENIDDDENRIKGFEAAEKQDRERDRKDRQAIEHSNRIQTQLERIGLGDLDRKKLELDDDYDRGMDESKSILNSDSRQQFQQNMKKYREVGLHEIEVEKTYRETQNTTEGQILSAQGKGDDYAARSGRFEMEWRQKIQQTINENGNVGQVQANAALAKTAFDATERRSAELERFKGAQDVSQIEGETSENSLRSAGNRDGAERARLVREGDAAVAMLNKLAEALDRTTKGSQEYEKALADQNKAQAIVKQNAQAVAQFDIDAARHDAEAVSRGEAAQRIGQIHAGGDFGGEQSAVFEERQQRENEELYDRPHTQAEEVELADRHEAEFRARKGDVQRQAQRIGLLTLQSAAVIAPELQMRAKYESLRERIIQEQGDAAPENKDAINRLARIQISAFESEQMTGGWHGTQTFNGTKAMTDIVRQSQQMSGPDYMQSKMKIIDDKLGLYFGDKLKSDFGNGGTLNDASAILNKIYGLLEGTNVQQVGIIKY